jgi:hypothetical protein
VQNGGMSDEAKKHGKALHLLPDGTVPPPKTEEELTQESELWRREMSEDAKLHDWNDDLMEKDSNNDFDNFDREQRR